jgi:MtN3 and saliva related transmembrane protein
MMDSWLPTAVGLLAGILSTWSFVPQILKIWREGDTEAISVRMFAIRSFGSTLWAIYGYGVGSLPVLIFSALNLVLSTAILVLKLRASKALQAA